MWGLSDTPADRGVVIWQSGALRLRLPTCQPTGHHLLSEHFGHQWVGALVPNADPLIGAKWQGNLPHQHFFPNALPEQEGPLWHLWDGEVQAYSTSIPPRHSNIDATVVH